MKHQNKIIQDIHEKISKTNIPFGYAVPFMSYWYFLRYLDYKSSFVEYSKIRLGMAISLPLIVFPLSILFLNIRKKMINITTPWILPFISCIVLAFFGFLLFFSRYQRKAGMGDVQLFKQSIVNTANFSGLLTNEYEKGSHFKAHNSPILLLMTPWIWLFGDSGWYIIQYLHSLTISVWAFWIGDYLTKWTKFPAMRWPLIISLFLATYTQHATFYDTRFAALGLAIWITAMIVNHTRMNWIGYIITLFSRETAVISMVTILSSSYHQLKITKKLLWYQIILSISWIVMTILLMINLGGPNSIGRFNECISHPQISTLYFDCIKKSLMEDLNLKLGYTSRLLSFAPQSILQPLVLFGSAPDLLITWLSKDNVLYSLSWHYYMPILSILILLSSTPKWLDKIPGALSKLLILWMINTAIWQFLTTFQPNLF
jgi:hypothetical protein